MRGRGCAGGRFRRGTYFRQHQSVSSPPARHKQNSKHLQPRHSEPADGEEAVEDEQKRRGDNAGGRVPLGRRLALVDRVCNRQHGHGQRHADGAEQHQRAPADLFDQEHGDPGRDEVLGAVAGGEDARDEGGQADVVFVNVCGVVSGQGGLAIGRGCKDWTTYVMRLIPLICWNIWFT